MTTTLAKKEHVYSLTETDRARIWEISAQAASKIADDPAALAAHLLELPEELTRCLQRFVDVTSSSGFFLVRGIEIGDVPETPWSHGAPLAEGPTSGVLALVADVLGSLVGYEDEKEGALIHEVYPVRGEESRIENSGSVTFDFHTENVHHPLRPDFLGLLCLRRDHDGVATTCVSSVREAITQLAPEPVRLLREPQFCSLYPTSFTRRRSGPRPFSGPHPVIFGPGERAFLRYNSHNTMAAAEPGRTALTALAEALEQVSHDVLLEPGDLVLIDNHVAVHGRSAFRPRYDGRDRWLRRFYSIRSIPRWTRQMMRAPRILPPMAELQGVL